MSSPPQKLLVMELAGYINEHFQRAAADPQDNLLGDLAAARTAGELTDLTALNIMATLFSAGGESTASLIGSAAHVFAALAPASSSGFVKTLTCWAHSSRRYCAMSHLSAGTIGTWSVIRRCTVSSSSQGRAWSCSGAPPTAIRHTSTIQRIPAGPRRRQRTYLLRQRRTLLCRRRTSTPGGPNRVAPIARSHDHGSTRLIPAAGRQACW